MNGDNDGSRPTQAPADAQRSGEFWTLVPREAGDVAVVNATGYRIFQMCDGTCSEADIAQDIAAAAGVAVERVRPDVARFVTRLETAGLLNR